MKARRGDDEAQRSDRHAHVRMHEHRRELQRDEHGRVRAQRDAEQHERRVLRQRHQDDLQRVLPEGRQPVHRLGRMVNLVQAPQRRDRVRQPVVRVAAQLEQQEPDGDVRDEACASIADGRQQRAIERHGVEPRQHQAGREHQAHAHEHLADGRERRDRSRSDGGAVRAPRRGVPAAGTPAPRAPRTAAVASGHRCRSRHPRRRPASNRTPCRRSRAPTNWTASPVCASWRRTR